MPYIRTLESRLIAASPSTIFREMSALLELDITNYLVSFKQSRGATVGVDLPIGSGEGRARKKRWWEVGPHPNQLNLPFQLYQPAFILRREYVAHRREMRIWVQYEDDGGNAQKRLLRYNDGSCDDSCDDSRNNVIALQLHKIVRTLVPDAAEGVPLLTAREAAELLRVAGTNGLDIQLDSVALDRVTGDVVGTEFRLLPSGSRLNNSGESLEACCIRLRDGEQINFYIERRALRQLHTGLPTGEECIRMVTQAARYGMVITSTGRVYNKVSGELIGTCASLDALPPVEVERGELSLVPPSNRCGDMRLLNGRRFWFQIESSLLDCRGISPGVNHLLDSGLLSREHEGQSNRTTHSYWRGLEDD